MATTEAITTVRQKYRSLSPIMDERMRRRWAASEAVALGWGGITAVAEATGLSLRRSGWASPNPVPPKPIRTPSPTILMSDARVAGESDSPRRIGLSSRTWRPWSIPRPGETPSPRYDGPARAHEIWRRPWSIKATGSAIRRWPGCSRRSGYNLQVNRKNREGRIPPRPGCPVRVHRQASPFVPEARSAGRVGRHEEEGIGRGFQERRAGMATRGLAGRGPLQGLQG